MAFQKELRAAERLSVNANSTCNFASPVLEDFGPVKILNISTNGIGFVTTEQVHPDLLFAIRLVNPAKKFSRIMLVRVVHVTPQTGGTFMVGGQFETPLSYEELCILVM
jgi:PilZ domain